MKHIVRISVVLAGAILVLGCAITVPREMKLADPMHRRTVDHPGKDIDVVRLACAETMLNASPATEATQIDVRVISANDPVVTEVDAVLMGLGLLGQNLAVTYRCEYKDGYLTLGTWIRGLKGGGR